MPVFSAPITTDRLPFVEAYALSIAAPLMDPVTESPPITAYIVPEVPGCCISETLAREYDPQIQERELLMLGIEVAQSTIAKYPGLAGSTDFTELQVIPAQPCRGHRVHRLICGANGLVQAWADSWSPAKVPGQNQRYHQ